MFLCLVAVIPLIVDNEVFFPYVSGKELVFQLLIVLSLLCLIIEFVKSENYRTDLSLRLSCLIRDKLFLSFVLLVFVSALSLFVAPDLFAAFWGSIERGGGVVNIIFSLALIILFVLLFKKRDWFIFMALNIPVGLILVGYEISEYTAGISRPGSFTGNPSFLSGNLLFLIFSSVLLIVHVRHFVLRVALSLVALLSCGGILLTETRGTLLGLLVGSLFLLGYFWLRGGGKSLLGLNLRKASGVVLLLLLFFALLFGTTMNHQIWQNIPGLSRLSQIDIGTDTIVPRLNVLKTGIDAVNPEINGWKRFMVGWGQENFLNATLKHYKIEQYRFESSWFDQAHNKFVDTLVCLGLVGLLLYLLFWFAYFFYCRRAFSGFSYTYACLVFWGIAYIVHLFFLFEQISYLGQSLFVVAYVIYLNTETRLAQGDSRIKASYRIPIIITSLVTLFVFLILTFSIETAPSYIKMRQYFSIVNYGNILDVSKISNVTDGMTRAQLDIRRDLLARAVKEVMTSNQVPPEVLSLVVDLAEDYIKVRPLDLRFLSTLADSYNRLGKRLGNNEYLNRGELYLRHLLSYTGERPDIIYNLALNLAHQGNFEESLTLVSGVIIADREIAESYCYFGIILWWRGGPDQSAVIDNLETCFELKPWLFERQEDTFLLVYKELFNYFNKKENRGAFISVLKRLNKNGHLPDSTTNSIIEYLNSHNDWPIIELE